MDGDSEHDPHYTPTAFDHIRAKQKEGEAFNASLNDTLFNLEEIARNSQNLFVRRLAEGLQYLYSIDKTLTAIVTAIKLAFYPILSCIIYLVLKNWPQTGITDFKLRHDPFRL
jgi:hypothetical protein